MAETTDDEERTTPLHRGGVTAIVLVIAAFGVLMVIFPTRIYVVAVIFTGVGGMALLASLRWPSAYERYLDRGSLSVVLALSVAITAGASTALLALDRYDPVTVISTVAFGVGATSLLAALGDNRVYERVFERWSPIPPWLSIGLLATWWPLSELFVGGQITITTAVTITALVAVLFVTTVFPGLAIYQKRTQAGDREAAAPYPDVSVIVPACDEKGYVGRCVESLLSTDYPEEHREIIVVDDGSTDGTYREAAQYREAGVQVYHRENGGKHAALNFGLLCSSGDVIVTVDADSVVERDALSRAVGTLQADTDVGAVAGYVNVLNRTNLVTRSQALEYIVSINVIRRTLDLFDAVPIVPGCLGAYRREVLDELGGFDPDTLTEDFDLTVQILKRGWTVKSTEATVWTEGPSTWRDLYRQRIRWKRGNLMTLLKHRDVFYDPRFGALHRLSFPLHLLSAVPLPMASVVIVFVVTDWLVAGRTAEVALLLITFTFLVVLVIGLAIQLADDDLRLLAYAPLFVVGYKHFRDYIRLKGLFDVLVRRELSWTRARRDVPADATPSTVGGSGRYVGTGAGRRLTATSTRLRTAIDRTQRRLLRGAGSIRTNMTRTVLRWSGSKADYMLLAALVLIGGYVYFVALGAHPLRRYDEALYANVAKEMVVEGRWLVPHRETSWGIQPYLDKPPLVFWLQAASILVLGLEEFAIRFPSALFTVLTGVLVYVMGRELFDRASGFFAGLVWLSTPYVFSGTNAGRFGGVDTTYVFFGTAFVYLTWRAIDCDRSAWLLPAGVAAGLAVLVKGFSVGIFAIVLLPILIAGRDLLLSNRRHALGGAGVGALLVLPWPLLAWLHYGSQFVERIFLNQVLMRITGDLYASPVDGLFGVMKYPYFREIGVQFDPWVYFLLPSIAFGIWRAHSRTEGRGRDVLFLSWWAGSILGFFAITGNHAWYLLPTYVPAALLVGHLFAGVTAGLPSARWSLIIGAIAAVLLSFRFATISPLASVPETASVPVRELRRDVEFLIPFVFGLLAVLSAPIVRGRASRHLPDRWYRGVRNVLPAAIAVALVLAAIGFPPVVWWQGDAQQKQIATAIDRETPAGAVVYIEPEVAAQPLNGLAFYSARPRGVVAADAVDESDRIRYALLRRESLEAVERDYEVLYRGRLQYFDRKRFHLVLISLERNAK